MSCGKAIITTDAPGCRETVIEGQNGFLVPVKDEKAVAEKMQFLFRNPAICAQMVDFIDGKLNGFRYIIHDNDTLFSGRFTDILLGAGCKTKHTRPFCPEQNGYVESFVKTFKTECLDQLILTSDEQLRHVVKEFLLYYNHERPHSGLGGKLIDPWPQDDDGGIVMFSRLGGLLKSYRRVKQAA